MANTALVLTQCFAEFPGPPRAVVKSTGGWYWLADALAPLGVERRGEPPRDPPIQAQRRRVRTITVDNETELHDYAAIEQATTARFYFATLHHALERGTNENTNGHLLRPLAARLAVRLRRIAHPITVTPMSAGGVS